MSENLNSTGFVDSRKPKFNLRKLPFSPNINPLVEQMTVTARKKQVRTGGVKELVNSATGEVHQAVIVEEQELDEIQFVKVFTAGIRASFSLTLTGLRVYQEMLKSYQSTPLSGGFVDSVYLHFFDGCLDGRKLNMSEKTYQRGLLELLDNGFLFPRGQNLFWVNPNLFFRGDRVTFIKTYRKKKSDTEKEVRIEQERQAQLI